MESILPISINVIPMLVSLITFAANLRLRPEFAMLSLRETSVR